MTRLSIEQLLIDLKARDIRLWLDDGRLRLSAPKGALTDDLKDVLAQRKAELRDFLEAASNAGDLESRPVSPAERGDEIPLSFDQQRMWLLNQMATRGSAYHLQTSFLYQCDPKLVLAAWDALVARHEILRTTYHVTKKGDLRQRIHASSVSRIETADLTNKVSPEIRSTLMESSRRLLEQRFDLSEGPVWRAICFALPQGYSFLLLTIHHIASDGWSLGRLTHELKALCEAYLHDRQPILPPLPVQYADYAIWQRNYLQGPVLEQQLGYWKKRLSGMPPVLELPLDYQRPAVQTENGSTYSITLPKELATGIRKLCQERHVTTYMALLALFKVLLSRYTGQTDIVVGTPIAGRTRPETENVQGMFLNNLVLRTEISGDGPFDQLLSRVRQTVLDAFAHQDLPFDVLVKELQEKRDVSRNQLFQVMFNSLIVQPPGLEIKKLGLEEIIADISSNEKDSQVDLSLEVYEVHQDIVLNFTFNTDLFEKDTIKRVAGHYINLAKAVVVDSNQAVCGLPMLDEKEHKKITNDWNDTAKPFSEGVLTQLFEAQVRKRPDATAAEFGDETLSYWQLNTLANRLAHYLRRHGVGAESKVGVLLERSLSMLVTVLAVQKAGGAYVPLDPSYPQERLAFMLEDSGARVLITDDELAEELRLESLQVINLSKEHSDIGAEPEENLEAGPTPADLAYIIYTSGSTGIPKGVEVTQGSLSNFLQSMADVPGLNRSDVLIAVTTLSFDIAALELYLPLIVGARLVIASRETAMDGVALRSLIELSNASVLQATPATWRMLLEAGWRGRPGMKLLSGGEALAGDLAERLAGCCDQLWNLYGPTETTVWSTAYRVTPDRPIMIGRPIANTRVYILDDRLRTVPIGVPGEVYIGGRGVARGYWNRPELNKEKFLSDPYGASPEARMYRTGDLARFSADGNIEYLGRIDSQIKLRGYRIELGEVESVMASHPEVAAAVAIVREDVPGDQRLVAYGMAACGEPPTDVKAFLQDRLPLYMVPASIVWLESFPLTPNGKIDRKALPAPSRQAGRRSTPPAEHKSEYEAIMTRIWEELLEIDDVQPFDTFFDLGGHSLLTLKAVTRFEQLTGKKVKPADFVGQSLRQIVAGLETDHSSVDKASAPHFPIGETPSSGFLSSIRNVFSK